ncbi:LTA synthase family protein [uncultured Alistipes sp.]|uniref:LTA synthase family protein n=1 Tax=uncultured Alistipes sp. TaxID=538949 RepID=UPI0025EA1964|nr:LTA synthase family protein [uncultured Alistipes sp.]
MKRLLHTPTAMLLRRIALLYVVLMLCRVLFYLYNAQQLGPLAWSELGSLLQGALKFDTASVVYANGVFVVLSLLPLHLRERRWYRQILYWYYVVVNAVLIVAVNMADSVYFRFTQKRFTADEIFFADNSNSAQLVGKFMAENWYMVLATVALITLLTWGYGRRVREESLLSRGWAYYVGSTAILAVAAGLCIAGMRGGMTRMTRPITLSNATLYTSDSGKANLILSNPFCILRTIGSGGSVKYKKFFSPEELPRYFTPVHRPADSAAVNLTGRNVVIFIMESMSAEHSAHLVPEAYAGREIKGFTPFFDSLMRDGLCFRQMYANGSRSIQAMPSVLGSIPSFKTPFVLMPQSLGRSRQLPAVLRDKGYSTAFFCGSEHGSMGFGAYARSAGVERLVSREDYEARHGTGDFDGYWGIWDEPFLQFMGEELAQTREPFFATLFTLSSHHPFVVPAEYEDILPEGYTKIHKGVAYDDNAFRLFFERFGTEEWFTRTVFVFVADHVSSEKMAPETRTYPGNMHIIGFIYTPDGALRGEVTEVTQQLDIMPTVLGLLGNTEPYFAFGRDVLNEPGRPRWSVSYDGQFQAVMSDFLLHFNDDGGGFTQRGDVTAHVHTPDSDEAGEAPAALLDDFRAMVQQYYSHIEKKSYTVHD